MGLFQISRNKDDIVLIEFYVIFERTSKYYSVATEQTYQNFTRIFADNYEEAFKIAMTKCPKGFMNNIPDGEGVSIQVKPVPKECLIRQKGENIER